MLQLEEGISLACSPVCGISQTLTQKLLSLETEWLFAFAADCWTFRMLRAQEELKKIKAIPVNPIKIINEKVPSTFLFQEKVFK